MNETGSVRFLASGDLGVLEQVDDDVFDHPLVPSLCREFLADPRHHIAVAIEDGVVVGMASGVHYLHPDKPNQFWINEVGVAGRARRRGFAKRLLEALFARARELGCREAWVATEKDNEVARRLYRSVGGSEEEVVHATFDLSTRD